MWLTNPYAWPAVRRGSEAVMHGLAGWLRGQGVDARIAAGARHAGSYEIAGVPVTTVTAPDLSRFRGDLSPDVTMIPALARHLRRSRPQIVHGFHYCDGLAAAMAGAPRLLSFQGMPLFRGAGRFRRRLFDSAMKRSPVVVCPSRAAADHLLGQLGWRSEVIPNALATAEFEVEAERRDDVVFCAATPDDVRKRAEVVFDAFASLLEAGRDLELWVGGRAQPATRERLLGRLPDGARSRVSFLGDMETGQLARAYASATVSCLASLYEAFGVVVVESLAAGTPVAGAEHSAIPEIIDEEVGELFPVDDVTACAAALGRLIDRARGGAMTEVCRRRAARYDWSEVGPEWVERYEALL